MVRRYTLTQGKVEVMINVDGGNVQGGGAEGLVVTSCPGDSLETNPAPVGGLSSWCHYRIWNHLRNDGLYSIRAQKICTDLPIGTVQS
jgi:hypothetical protein